APNIIKKGAKDIFDFVYEPISWDEEEIDDEFALKAREAFYEEIDRLRKEKIIKATLEVEIVGDDSHFPFKDKDLEDWFVVSGFVKESDGERIGKFVVDEIEFDIVKSQNYKCPRCWRYKATKEGALCDRCQKVVNG
ncbi:MAG: isoleucine--tRNA ligase, partial [Epsilonproteobacteria bacterium]|nr:isoleucine--tRNA ligase [Campylobacterota bacterium]